MAEDLREWVSEYRRLLVAQASLPALDSAIELMERIACVEIADPGLDKAIADLDHQASAEEECRRRLSERLQDYLESSFEDARLRRRRKRDLIRLQAEVWRTASAVRIPGFLASRPVEISPARESLLLDAGLVVFHHAYFALLPAVPVGFQGERNLLFQSFLEFSSDLTSGSDRERVRALVHEALGDPILAAEHYRQALDAASPDRHDYLSLVHMAWAHAVERNRLREAMTILLESAARVRAEDYAEIKDLVLETLEMQRTAA